MAGAVYAPAIGRLWVGGSHAYVCDVAEGAQLPRASLRRPIRTRPALAGLVALASRSHCDQQTEAFLAGLPIVDRRSKGSSLKFCEIAEGLADVYPRFGPTMEWDTAAADAVLRAAGGIVLDLHGQPLLYGKTDMSFRNGPFVAWGDALGPAPVRQSLTACQQNGSKLGRASKGFARGATIGWRACGARDGAS